MNGSRRFSDIEENANVEKNQESIIEFSEKDKIIE
jgi:hypothetical protein